MHYPQLQCLAVEHATAKRSIPTIMIYDIKRYFMLFPISSTKLQIKFLTLQRNKRNLIFASNNHI